MFHALSTVLREEGPRALYKGWTPSVIGVVSPRSLDKKELIISTYDNLITMHTRFNGIILENLHFQNFL